MSSLRFTFLLLVTLWIIKALLILVMYFFPSLAQSVLNPSNDDSFIKDVLMTIAGAMLIAMFFQTIPLSILQAFGEHRRLVLILTSAVLMALFASISSWLLSIVYFCTGVIMAICWLHWRSRSSMFEAWFWTAMLAGLGDLIPFLYFWAYRTDK